MSFYEQTVKLFLRSAVDTDKGEVRDIKARTELEFDASAMPQASGKGNDALSGTLFVEERNERQSERKGEEAGASSNRFIFLTSKLHHGNVN